MSEPSAAASVRLERLSKSFDGIKRAVDGVDLAIEAGEFFALLGPSGCGKTTTLRMIAGFETPDEGRIHVGGADVTDVPVHRRDLGMIFQSYALFPHRSVAENVAFGLRMRGLARRDIAEAVARALKQVALAGYEERRPGQLSGGEQQRVALARALAPDPAILVADEPTGNLDDITGKQIVDLLFSKHDERGMTLVLVTHDTQLAQRCDRVVRLRSGRIDGETMHHNTAA
jgi:ABC-type Fe3+/spermidine/putrescine transport system ATPase subunit